MMLLAVFVHFSLVAADAPVSTTWQFQTGAQTQYLTIRDGTACIQSAEGTPYWSARLVSDAGGVVAYRMGQPMDQQLAVTASEVTLTDKGGSKLVFTPCAAPPEPIGWQPYDLPPTVADPAKRKQIADELVKRFNSEQQLRREALQISHGQMDQATMAKPEVQAKWKQVNATDEDNRKWLEATLRHDGWIGRKTHGDKATEALLLIGLHNITYLRLGATLQAQFLAEWKRGEVNEMPYANITDRFALMLAAPLSYGIQAGVDPSGQPVVPVIADGDQLDANRKRIGQPTMAAVAAQMGTKVLRIGADGKLVGEGAANAKGLDTIDQRHVLSDPVWGMTAVTQADPVLAAALTAAKAGDAALLTAWAEKAGAPHRALLANLLMEQGQIAGGAAGAAADAGDVAVVALRPAFDALIATMENSENERVLLANTLAYGLVARATPPTHEELIRAVALDELVERALGKPEVTATPLGHALADTVACVRFRQGDLAQAATWWRKAIALAGAKPPELYTKRLAMATAGDAKADLPR